MHVGAGSESLDVESFPASQVRDCHSRWRQGATAELEQKRIMALWAVLPDVWGWLGVTRG